MPSNFEVAAQVARINRNLMRVADQAEADVMMTVLTQASLVASEQRRLCPVDADGDTPGAARDSIRVGESEKKARTVVIRAGGPATTKKLQNGHDYDYVRAIEYGTEDMQPQPFFWPIWRARKKGVRAAVRLAIKTAVRKVFK